ncbi:MAG TPA: hypothetical protein VFS96_04730 [Nitrolancea sp.]|nr:hypothetical protein [Nitrolancea sp.]
MERWRSGCDEAGTEHLQINIREKRHDRQDLVARAHPQRGVDAFKGAFPNVIDPPPGVEEAGSVVDPLASD